MTAASTISPTSQSVNDGAAMLAATQTANGTDVAKSRQLRSTFLVLLGGRLWPVAALVAGALVAGLIESTILALAAYTATGIVDGATDVTAHVGPLVVDARMPTVLAVAGVLAVGRVALQIGLAYLPARIAGDTQARLRRRLFDAYSRASWDVQAEERDGHLQELMTSQIGQTTRGVIAVTKALSAASMFAMLVLAALLLSPVAAALILMMSTAMFALLRPLSRRGRRSARELSAAQMAYAGGVGEAVRLAEETYTFGAAAAERARVGRRIARARRHVVRTQFTLGLAGGIYQSLVIVLLVGGLAGLYAAGTAPIASLGAVVLILVRAAAYGQQGQSSWHLVQQTAPFLERLSDAESRYRASAPPEDGQSFPEDADLHFEAVSFAYQPGVPVLTDVSFSVVAGEVIGIVGPSGAGKTTLVQLLLRMRSPAQGRYLVGGVPVEDIALHDWRRRVAYVPQEPRLLHATVADNIRFFRDLDDAVVERAAAQAHIHDDITAMAAGYDTIIGQRASAVSGGQRQRICLARALAGDPAVLVLDEPTSALDLASEAAVQESLADMRGACTIFVVAHRPSLLRLCGRAFHVEHTHLSVLAPERLVSLTDAWASEPATGAPGVARRGLRSRR